MKDSLKHEYILASASPRRKQLLKEMGLRFKIIPSSIKEVADPTLSPSQLVRKLAWQKAADIAQRFRGKKYIVIGADTIVVRKGEILGKPRDPRHARQILHKLSDSVHFVYTGVAVIDAVTDQKIIAYEKTRVKMKKLSREEIKYHSGRHLDKAGAYAVQEEKDAFIERIDGCYYNVVGLPRNLLKGMLKKINSKSKRQ
ncbi:MAG: Maf family protein [bacterium]|nr:Maf family protein [bacterium]MDD5354369.1 Maf family protein [bacterium]MDD5756007.1 Maf family protein [bacterium]